MTGDGYTTRIEPSIHESAWVAPGARLIGDVTLGRDASVWYGCVLRGDIAPITVGSGTNLQDLTVVHVDPDRPTVIGDRVGIGHRAIIHGCVIEGDCLIGMGAIVLSHSVIGSGSLVASGALVLEGMKVPPGSLVIGVPGRVIRDVGDRYRERIERTVADYRALKEAHRAGRWVVGPGGLAP